MKMPIAVSLICLAGWSWFGSSVAAQCPPGQVCPVPELAPKEANALPEPVARAMASVCMIDNRGFGGGSGVYLGQGLVLSCDHLFRDERGAVQLGRIVATFPSGVASTARVLRQDKTWDLSLLALDHPPAGIAAIALAESVPRVGQTLVSCGFGGQGTIRAQVGQVTSFGHDKYRAAGALDTIIVTGSARPGDSGGPIFDTSGRLCGVLWGTDGRTVVGTQTGRCWRFGGEYFCSPGKKPPGASPSPPPNSQPTIPAPAFPTNPPVVEPPNAPPITPPVTSPSHSELSQLREELALLRQEIAQLQARPLVPGPPGPAGPPGANGRDAAASPVNIDRVAEAVKRKLSGSIRIQVEPVE